MRKMSPKDAPLYDGRLKVYEVGNIAPPGAYPEQGLRLVWELPYQERTVGIARYYAAQEHKTTISQVVRCPRPPLRTRDDGQKVEPVSTLEKVILPGGVQYDIAQVQYIEDTMPRMMDLSLSVTQQRHEVQSDA